MSNDPVITVGHFLMPDDNQIHIQWYLQIIIRYFKEHCNKIQNHAITMVLFL